MKSRKVDVITSNNIRGIVEQINKYSIKKDDIVGIFHDITQYFLLYYKDDK